MLKNIKRIFSAFLATTLIISTILSTELVTIADSVDITIPEGSFSDLNAVASAFKYQTEEGYAPTFENGAVTLKRATTATATNNKAGIITHIKTLPAGDYVWQFELTMKASEAMDDGTYKTACDFGVYKAINDTEYMYYGTKGIPTSSRYIDLDNISIDKEKNNQRPYCTQIRNFGTPYFHYTGETTADVDKHYYVTVDFTLTETTQIALSVTTAGMGYTATVDNFHLFKGNDEEVLKSFEYMLLANSNCNFSLDTEENYLLDGESGKYQSIKYSNSYTLTSVEDSYLWPQAIYSSRTTFYHLTKGNEYKIKFKYKCTDLATQLFTNKVYPITVYATCGMYKDSKNNVENNSSNTIRYLLNTFDSINSTQNKAYFTINETSSEWKDGEINFWAYNANGAENLDLEITELLSLSVNGKGTVYFDEIEVIDLGDPLESEITATSGNLVTDGNYYFAPYGAVTQNGELCEKNADGSFNVTDGALTQKLYPRTTTGLSVYEVKSVERGDETLFFNTKPGMIFSVFVENYLSANNYGTLVIRNASEETLTKIDDTVKADMVKTFIESGYKGWNDYSVDGTIVSFSVIENEQETKGGDSYLQFDIKIYGDLDRNIEKDGVPYKDMKVSVSAYCISSDVYSFSEDFKSAAYSNNVFKEITYNSEAVVENHTGTGGILPFYWQYGDESGNWYTYTEEQLQKCVEQLKGLNVSIVRCLGFKPGFAWNAETNDWDWNTKYMQAFYEYAKVMYENGIDIIINTTAGSVNSSIGEDVPTALGSTDVEIYPIFVSEFYKNVVLGEGLPEAYKSYAEYLKGIEYFMYATEPNNGDDTTAEDYDPSQSEKLINYKNVLEATHNRLTDEGIRSNIKLVGPNTVDYSEDVKTVRWAIENLDDYIDVYSAHSGYVRTYDMTNDDYAHWQKFNDACQAALKENGINKPFWHDEYNIFMISAYGGYDASYDNAVRGTQLATAQLSMMQSGANSSLLWTLFDFKWSNSFRSSDNGFNKGFFEHGLAPSVFKFTNVDDAYEYAPYYAYSVLGTAIKKGDTVYSGTVSDTGIYTVLLKHTDGKYSIVAVNNSANSASLRINIPDDASGKYTRIAYNPYETRENGFGTNSSSTINAIGKINSTIGAYGVAVFNLN